MYKDPWPRLASSLWSRFFLYVCIYCILLLMNLDQEILHVLAMAGNDGLKTEKIARHVYNACNSIFTPLDYSEVHAYVTAFLIKCSHDPKSIIIKGDGWGVYRIDFLSNRGRQLKLKFSAHTATDVAERDEEASNDQSLSLF